MSARLNMILVTALLTIPVTAHAQESDDTTAPASEPQTPASSPAEPSRAAPVRKPEAEAAAVVLAQTPAPTDPRRTALALTSRVGMLTTAASLDSRRIVPAVGVGLEVPASKLMAVSFHYDFAFERRGVDDVWVDRKSQYFLGTLDFRVPIFRAAYLRTGIGVGGVLVAATSHAFDDSRTAWDFRAGAAWNAGLTTNLPRTPFDVTLGASGLIRESSHDVLFFAGLSYSFDHPPDRAR